MNVSIISLCVVATLAVVYCVQTENNQHLTIQGFDVHKSFVQDLDIS